MKIVNLYEQDLNLMIYIYLETENKFNTFGFDYKGYDK